MWLLIEVTQHACVDQILPCVVRPSLLKFVKRRLIINYDYELTKIIMITKVITTLYTLHLLTHLTTSYSIPTTTTTVLLLGCEPKN